MNPHSSNLIRLLVLLFPFTIGANAKSESMVEGAAGSPGWRFHESANEVELAATRFAVTENSEGDRMFIYLGNRREAWLRFVPVASAPVDPKSGAAAVRIDENPEFVVAREGSRILGRRIFASPSLFLVRQGFEWSLGTSTPNSGRSESFKALAQGSVLHLTYFSAARERKVSFPLGHAELAYQALEIRDAMENGTLENVENYLKFSYDISTSCSMNSVRQDYSECMKPFKACKVKHPSDFRELMACAESSGVQLNPVFRGQYLPKN